MSVTHRPMTAEEYDAAAWEYYHTLPMEHFMEATPQATQREVTLVSFANLKLRRRDISYFSELLVQYWFNGVLCRVVPDNMLVVGDLPDHRRSSFAIDLEPVRPFMVLEWVSDSSEGKDYGDSFLKYEQELCIPYCLCFHPDKGSWQVYRHDEQRYERLEPNLKGRVEVPELDLEIGLHEGWIRFWYQGVLLEVPAETQQRMDRLESENKRKTELLEQQSEHIVRQSEQLEQQSEHIVRQSEQLEQQSEHIVQQSEQLEQQSEHIVQQSEQLEQQSEHIVRQSDQLEQQSEHIVRQSEHIDHLGQRLAAAAERFRRLVLDRASKAGRQDVLDELPQADFEKLEQWLREL